MDEITKYHKWCLAINKEDIGMPTQEHALRMGKYLRAFNVPLKVIEVVISVQKDENGKIKVINSKRHNRSHLMD